MVELIDRGARGSGMNENLGLKYEFELDITPYSKNPILGYGFRTMCFCFIQKTPLTPPKNRHE